jgi:putative sterol carrier protein
MCARLSRPILQLLGVFLLSAPTPGTAQSSAPEPAYTSPQEVFDGMRAGFRADKAKGVHVRYQFDLTGPAGGQWCIEVNDGKLTMARGLIENANVTLSASDRDWVALANGKLNGTWAVFTGRLKVVGPHWLARKLDEMFP